MGQVQWSDNWVTFIDSMLQLSILQSAESSQSLQKPVSFQKLVINPTTHKEPTQVLEAVAQRHTGVINCGGVEIRGLKTESVDDTEIKISNFNLESLKFIPHNKTGLLV